MRKAHEIAQNLCPDTEVSGIEVAPPPPLESAESLDPVQQVTYPYGVGIDTHSKFIAVCILYRAGNEIRRKEESFNTDWPSLVRGHAWALSMLKEHATRDSLRYCIESTGTYHLPVLRAWGGVPSVVNPVLAGPTRRKTDVLDARLLAHHSITGMWPESFIPTEDAMQLRVLWAQRREATRNYGRAANRINNIILRFGHTLGAATSMRTSLAEGILDDLCHGRIPDVPHVAPSGLPEAMRPVISGLMQDMEMQKQRVRAAHKACVQFVEAREWPTATTRLPGEKLLELLQTVPGVGDTSAIAWLSEVTDPRRFRDKHQVAAYCGCDPSLKVSAGKVTSHTRRAGNTRLHHALSYAAQALLRTPREQIGIWGKSIAGRHKKGGYKKAVGAISRRIAVSLWYVHCKGEPFSYEGYNFETSPNVPAKALSELLTKAQVRLVEPLGINDTQALALAFHKGQLASIAGMGEKTLAAIKQWILDNKIRPKVPRRNALTNEHKRVYTIKTELNFSAKPTKKGQKSK